MKRQITNPRELQREIEALLAASGTEAAAVLDAVAEKMFAQRPYSAVAIYVSAGRQSAGERAAARGAERGAAKASAAGSRIEVPIEISSQTLGVLEVESARSNAFGYAEQVFLKQVARALALYLSVKGKALRRKLREAAEQAEKKQPEAEGGTRKAAAGETSQTARRAMGASSPRA